MKILIGGGTGFVGKRVVRLFKEKNHKVTIISRNPGKETVTWEDLKKKNLVDGSDVVLNLAGENILNPLKRWNESFKKEVLESRVNSTSLLSSLIQSASTKPKLFISSSAIGIYPPDPKKEYTEDSDLSIGYHDNFITTLCHKWEKSADLSDNNKDTRHAIVRIGVVLGKEGGVIQSLLPSFKLGLGAQIGSGDQWFPWIHIDDLARLFLFIIENEKVNGILNGISPNPVTNKDFTKTLASSLKRPAFLSLPEFLFNVIYSEERAQIITQGQRVFPKRVENFGFKFRFETIEKACRNL